LERAAQGFKAAGDLLADINSANRQALSRCSCRRLGDLFGTVAGKALTALLGPDAPNLSPAVISRLTGEWKDEYERWQKRDLSARHYAYAWADGVYLQARMEDHGECMLVLIGATPEGKKELIGFQIGVRESAQSWRELLVDVKSRGLNVAPEIAVGDGALGFWKAIEEIFPGTRHQRCWVQHADFQIMPTDGQRPASEAVLAALGSA
jgi:transposase-like protein